MKSIMVAMEESEAKLLSSVLSEFSISDVVYETDPFRTSLSFICPKGQVEMTLAHQNFRVDLNRKGCIYEANQKIENIKANIPSEINLYSISKSPSNKDKKAIYSLLANMGKNYHSSSFDKEIDVESDEYVHLMGYDLSGGAWTVDPEFTRDFIDIGEKLGVFDNVVKAELFDSFFLGENPLKNPAIEASMIIQFDQTFKILKKFKHTIKNAFNFNDMDNDIYYIETALVKGVVYSSQNQFYCIAKHKETNILKAWKSIDVSDTWWELFVEELEYAETDITVFNAFEAMQSIINVEYNDGYEYPMEFEGDDYKKAPKTLINDFDKYKEHLIYSSDIGFIQKHWFSFNAVLFQLSNSLTHLCDWHEESKSIYVENNVNYTSPEYFIRRAVTRTAANRADALFKLFLCRGNEYIWNGKGFYAADDVMLDYPFNPKELIKGHIGYNCFLYQDESPIFKLPKDITPEWLEVAHELVGYVKEWIEQDAVKQDKQYPEYLKYYEKIKNI